MYAALSFANFRLAAKMFGLMFPVLCTALKGINKSKAYLSAMEYHHYGGVCLSTGLFFYQI